MRQAISGPTQVVPKERTVVVNQIVDRPDVFQSMVPQNCHPLFGFSKKTVINSPAVRVPTFFELETPLTLTLDHHCPRMYLGAAEFSAAKHGAVRLQDFVSWTSLWDQLGFPRHRHETGSASTIWDACSFCLSFILISCWRSVDSDLLGCFEDP